MKEKTNSWQPFGISLLKTTANSANFYPYWTGLAVLFSRQILNGSQHFFMFEFWYQTETKKKVSKQQL